MAEKFDVKFIEAEYNKEPIVENYTKAAINIGLWESEKIIFTKYINKDSKLLDVGCGAGRTTIGLYKTGYKNIIGLDLSETLINEAKKLNPEIEFVAGNALNLQYNDNTFDAVIFSFNGIMQIPGSENRLKAMKEIKRVLKENGVFIFTAHDRIDKDNKFKEFWNEEKKKWEEGKQDPRLHEFGDLIIIDYEEETFIHIAEKKEILDTVKEAGLTIIEDILRSELCDESDEVMEFSTDCRFYISKK